MTEKKTLEWGQTPWDNMTRAELLRLVQKMWAALNSVTMPLEVIKDNDLRTNKAYKDYWGESGVGGCALERAHQIIDPIMKEYDGENLYRAFYRYATDLLFDASKYDIGFKWVICSECGEMTPTSHVEERYLDKRCTLTNKCKGTLRRLTWDDLKPNDITDKEKVRVARLLLQEALELYNDHAHTDACYEDYRQARRLGQAVAAWAKFDPGRVGEVYIAAMDECNYDVRGRVYQDTDTQNTNPEG
jgi:hypothetical protein